MTAADKHFYEPSKGHGLSHDPFNAIIGPRPIGWVSSRGADGSVNLAPYSFFNGFNYIPPIIGFSSTSLKDTVRNCRETGEFVWNLATRTLADAMNQTCAPVPYGTSEFGIAGLAIAKARLVDVPMVAASPVNFECKVTEIINLKNSAGTYTPAWMVFGEVVAVHIDPAVLKEGVFDTFGVGVILRAGGPSAYAEIGTDSRFDMTRPK